MAVAQLVRALWPAAIDLVRKARIASHNLLNIVRCCHHEMELAGRKGGPDGEESPMHTNKKQHHALRDRVSPSWQFPFPVSGENR